MEIEDETTNSLHFIGKKDRLLFITFRSPGILFTKIQSRSTNKEQFHGYTNNDA